MEVNEIINEMDLLFNQIVKYYDMNDKKQVKVQWNELVELIKEKSDKTEQL